MTRKTEWEKLIDVAEQDYKAIDVLLETDVALSVSCFHAQQAIEKWIKAVLAKQQIKFPFTHDLMELYDLCVVNALNLPFDNSILEKLNPFAVKQRYNLPPDYEITREELKEIVDLMAKWCKEQCL